VSSGWGLARDKRTCGCAIGCVRVVNRIFLRDGLCSGRVILGNLAFSPEFPDCRPRNVPENKLFSGTSGAPGEPLLVPYLAIWAADYSYSGSLDEKLSQRHYWSLLHRTVLVFDLCMWLSIYLSHIYLRQAGSCPR
jgi:hypothetical protein